LTWSYHQRYGVPVTILRSAYLFGPYQSIQRLIPLIISHALKNQRFPIAGGNGDLRDIMYIDDFISAVELVLHNPEAYGQIYNVSAGIRVRVAEIADIILAILDRSKNLMQLDEQAESKSFVGLDATKIKNELGWKVDKSQDIHSMVEFTVNWFKEHKEWWDGVETTD
ncbi:GDP-mannose 4,6-dehydratase, partial [candidate division WWE3 bacterium]|nr:GDP-mannose 4,6-dehydratase [candidate division WWE3 bacterium]